MYQVVVTNTVPLEVLKGTVERNRYDYFVFHVKRCRLTISKTHTNVEPLLVTLEKIVVMSAFVPTRLYVDGKKRKEAIGKMSDEAFKLTVQLELHDLRRVHVIEWTTESQNGTECPK
ncbi:putative soluble maltase-glucoamylase [Ixodes scapularis]